MSMANLKKTEEQNAMHNQFEFSKKIAPIISNFRLLLLLTVMCHAKAATTGFVLTKKKIGNSAKALKALKAKANYRVGQKRGKQ